MIGQQDFTHRNGNHRSEVVVVLKTPIGVFNNRLNVKKINLGVEYDEEFSYKGGLARQSTRSVVDRVQWGK